MRPIRSPLPMLALVAAVLACATTYPRLEPAPSTAKVDDARAIRSIDGVTVEVESDIWPERADLRAHAVPLEVTIENASDRAITLRYQDFSLIGDDGRVYSALPPFEISGEIAEPVGAAVGYPVIQRPGFRSTRFYVSPYYAHFYPTLQPYSGRFYYDPFYYDHHFTLWRRVELPTHEMLERALPEGVIEPGGSVSGVVFFQPVDHERTDRVRFRFDLVAGADADVFGEVSIPFEVETTS